MTARQIELDGTTLTLDEVVAIARADADHRPVVALAEPARLLTRTVRRYVEENWLSDDAPAIYGINTGLGRLKDSRVHNEDLLRYQQLILNSHSAGVGEPLSQEEVRAVLVLRVNALAKGNSGLREECLDRLLAMLNAGVHPVIPSQGSVGASGDLAPLAHLVSAMVGHPQAEAFYQDRRLPAQEALAAAGLAPTFELAPKDVICMINGSTVSLAIAMLGLADALRIARGADVALALSLEAMRGEVAAFDRRIHEARNSESQQLVAANVRTLVAGSGRCTEAAREIQLPDEIRHGAYQARVQDAYALRCAPQVHGASRDLLGFARTLLEREANAATDNPLVFPEEDGSYVVLSGGNFHGEPIAFAADMTAMAVSEIGSISERRSYRLTEPGMSYGLPLNLVGGQLGLNTGFSLVHCSAAALASENKTLCFPASVDSIPTKANQEDHVSMSTHGSRKMRRIVENTWYILGIELILAAQGVDLSAPLLAGAALAPATQRAFDLVRATLPATAEDHFQSPDMYAAADLVRSGRLDAEFAEVLV
ncbi:MAG TPA: histidine ammonia-lyase [Cellulomonas sp.]